MRIKPGGGLDSSAKRRSPLPPGHWVQTAETNKWLGLKFTEGSRVSQTRPFILSHICKCLALGRVPLGSAGEGWGRDGGGRGGREVGPPCGRRERSQGGKEEAQPGTSRGGSGARIFPRCGPRYKGRHRPAAARSTTRDTFGAGSPEPSPCCNGKTLLSPHPHLHGATWPRRAGGSQTPRLRILGAGSRKPIRSRGRREPGSWMPA